MDIYTLCHNNIPVASVRIDEDYLINKILKVYDHSRFPLGVSEKGNPANLGSWLYDRAIPEKRRGLSSILEKENADGVRDLLLKNYGLGLSDHYWIKKENDPAEWKDINFFEHEFTKRGDDIFLGQSEPVVVFGKTPNSGTNGMLPKKWMVKNEERYLLKAGSKPYHQEPFNEKIISQFLEAAGIEHVHYDLVWYKDQAFSMCKSMLGKNEEFIPAFYISHTIKQKNDTSKIEHYINCCKAAGLQGNIRPALEKMIGVDYITANVDRHWNNFGIIRDANTLQPIKLAPVFDNGTSLYSHEDQYEIGKNEDELEALSFKKLHKDNIKLITDTSWVDKSALSALPDIIDKTLAQNKHIEETRRRCIVSAINKRIQHFEKIID